MTGAPHEPMTASDCDVRALPWMPLDVSRLLDSDLFAISTGDEFKAALALWAKSWMQVPAASIPDDDRVLAHLSGAGKDWPNVREIALRGWVLCSDGRYYHPVVAEKANEAAPHRLERKNSIAGDQSRKQRERDDRARMMADLRADGQEVAWNIRTGELRTRHADLSHLSRPDTGQGDEDNRGEPATKPPVTPTGHAPVTPVTKPVMAKTGTGTGRIEEELAAVPKPARTRDDQRGPDMPQHVARILRAAGMTQLPSDIPLIQQWIDLGGDLDHEIIPAVERSARALAGRTGKGPFKLKVLDDDVRRAIFDAQRDRERIAAIPKQIEELDRQQRERDDADEAETMRIRNERQQAATR